MPANPERLVLVASRLKLLLVLAVLLAALAVGLWVIGMTDDGWTAAWSWIGVLALGLGAIAALIQAFRPSRLVLTPEGFAIEGMIPVGLVAWSDVEAFVVFSSPPDADGHGEVPPQPAWRLKPDSEHRDGMTSRLVRLVGDIDGSLPTYLGRSPEEMVALMEDWRRRYS